MKTDFVAKYRFVIRDINGIGVNKSITRCNTVTQAQVLGMAHMRVVDYPKGYYVDVV